MTTNLPGLRAAAACAGAEVRQLLRDPHVIAYVLGPIALYPMLLWAVSSLFLLEMGRVEREPLRVSVLGEPLPPLGEPPFAPTEGDLQALSNGTIDLLVASTPGAAVLHHDSARPRSVRALDAARTDLRKLGMDRLRALAAGRVRGAFAPWEIEREAVGGIEAVATYLVSALVPGVAGLMMMLGAVYPAVSVVVAEREQGTLETLLVTPVPRWAPLVGKAAAATLAVLVSVLGNAFALRLTLVHMLALVGDTELATIPLHPLDLALAIPAVVATAFLVASASILVVLPARTFKDGEMILTGMVGVAMLPLVGGMLASVAGRTGEALFIPLTNATVVGAHALSGELAWQEAAFATALNTALGACFLGLAALLVQRADLSGQRA